MNSEKDLLYKLKIHQRIAIGMMIFGLAMIVIIGYVDDEPVLHAPLTVVVGLGWYIYTKRKIKSLKN